MNRGASERSPARLIVGENMGKLANFRLALLSATALVASAAAVSEAQAGAFGIREQSTYFTGDEYAGAAAGGDISSMFWNPAATATLQGFNSSTSYTGIIASATENATGGVLVNGGALPPGPVVLPTTSPTSTNVGTSALIPSSYWTLQLTDQLYAGLGLNAPFGLITKANNNWAGSPLATTTKVFSLDANPTLAYKITPTLTVGAGVQIEYFEIKLEHDSLSAFAPGPIIAAPSRSYQADDVGVGFTAGAIWQPFVGTSLGLGYRSAVNVNVNGLYALGQSAVTPLGLSTIATGKMTLPDEATFSVRQAITSQLTLLGTVEWDRWSSIGNVSATSALCGGTCETLNLNYQDGWFYSVGAEYAYSPALTLRTGVGYEVSPIRDSTRDILLPDSDRIHLGFGASYKWSDKITFNAAYSHIFFDNAPFCMAYPVAAATTHCVTGNEVLLMGNADVSVDIVSLGVNYKFYGPEPLEPLK
ncbi:MAG: OmpP1/FadL family transporter [Rhodomicrobium sp.]